MNADISQAFACVAGAIAVKNIADPDAFELYLNSHFRRDIPTVGIFD